MKNHLFKIINEYKHMQDCNNNEFLNRSKAKDHTQVKIYAMWNTKHGVASPLRTNSFTTLREGSAN
jgi:hypothetical protein